MAIRHLLACGFGAALAVACASAAVAAEWNPSAYAAEDTLEVQTIGPEEGEYWFPLWLVVLDNEVYIRLGSRAAERFEQSTTAPYVGVRVAGQQFDRIKTEDASDQAQRVADAMADKYWSDLFVRFFPHPVTLRLVAE